MPRLLIPTARPLLTVLVSCLAGCADYSPKPVAPEKSLRALEARRLDDSAVLERLSRQNIVAPDRAAAWGRAQLLVAALNLNPRVAEARAVLAQSVAAQKTARELQNPTLSLSSEYDLTRA